MTDRALRLAVVVSVVPLLAVLSGCSSPPENPPRFAFTTADPARALAVAGKSCTASFPSPGAGRRVTIDAFATVYLAAVCGDDAYVATSKDGAKTFGPPVPIGLAGLLQLTVQGGPGNVAYAVGMTSGGVARFTRTVDGGASWEAPRDLATGTVSTTGASVAARGDDVFVQVKRSADGLSVVYRNASRGAGDFTSTVLPADPLGAYSCLLVDSRGTLWSGQDNPALSVTTSTDGGATFAPWAPVTGASVYYSTWAIGADVIWVAGSAGSAVYRIPVATPTVGTVVTGNTTPLVNMETALAVDDAGTAYFAAASADGLALQRAGASDTSFVGTIVDALGRNPSLATPPGAGLVIVAYDRPDTGEIWTTVQAAPVAPGTIFFDATPPSKALAVAGKTCGAGALSGSAGRVSVDAAGTVYLAAICSGEGYVAASKDGAKTFGAAVPIGVADLARLTVQGGPDGVAYAVGATNTGVARFTRTTDHGATWEAARDLATGIATANGARIAARGDRVLVEVVQSADGLPAVYRNASRGAGAFTATVLTGTTAAYTGLLFDSAGTLWSGLDNPALYLAKSTDGGATFGPWAAVAVASVFYSTWAIGGDVIWVAGSSGSSAYRISVATPTVGTAVGGTAAPAASTETALAVDSAGSAYFAAGTGGGVLLQSAGVADTSFGASLTLDPLGRNPSLVVPRGAGRVLVAYDRPATGEVWTTLRRYGGAGPIITVTPLAAHSSR